MIWPASALSNEAQHKRTDGIRPNVLSLHKPEAVVVENIRAFVAPKAPSWMLFFGIDGGDNLPRARSIGLRKAYIVVMIPDVQGVSREPSHFQSKVPSGGI